MLLGHQEPDRLLPPHIVIERTSLSRTTLWRLCRTNAFPAPIKLSPGRVAWSEADITAWIASKREAA